MSSTEKNSTDSRRSRIKSKGIPPKRMQRSLPPDKRRMRKELPMFLTFLGNKKIQMSFSRVLFTLYLFEAHLQDVIKENEVILSIVRFFLHILLIENQHHIFPCSDHDPFIYIYIYNCHLCMYGLIAPVFGYRVL